MHRVPLILVLLAIGFSGPAFAQDMEFETLLDQARVYVKKKWYREAVRQLRRAVSTSEGKTSYDAHILLAQSCFREHDIGCALKASERARELARSREQKAASQGVLEYLQRNFGKVEFVARSSEFTEGYLELKPLDPIMDRDVKEYYKVKVVPLADQRRTLPWIMYLPAVRFELYGDEFKVEGGKETRVEAGFNAENSKQKPASKPEIVFRGIGIALDLRLGGGVALGTGGAFPGAVADVSMGYAINDMFGVSAFAKFNYDFGGVGYEALTFGALGRVRLPLTDRLVFVPAVGYGLGNGPAAVYTDCTIDGQLNDEGKEVVTCGGGESGQATLQEATLTTRTQGPVVRAEFAFERKSERNILSIRAGLQAHFGLVGTVAEGEGLFDYETTNRGVFQLAEGAPGLHPLRLEFLAGLNFTF